MAHLVDKAHLDKHTLARVNTALMLGLIGTGLAACVFGAVVYDIGPCSRLVTGSPVSSSLLRRSDRLTFPLAGRNEPASNRIAP